MSCPADSSGLKTSDAAIMARPGRLLGVELIGDGTNACNVIIYDHASAASGKVLAKLALPASGICYVDAQCDVVCNNGIYADVTGTGAAYIVHYALG